MANDDEPKEGEGMSQEHSILFTAEMVRAITEGRKTRGTHMRDHVRESTMGSYEQVRAINACCHEWIERHAILFGYMPVDWQCARCGTWWRKDEKEEQEG